MLGADVLTTDGAPKKSAVFVRDGKIAQVGGGAPMGRRDFKVVNAEGCLLSPGFIDLQRYGDPAKASAGDIKYGTTAFLSAIPCATSGEMLKRIRSAVKKISEKKSGAKMLGINIEGPYLNKEKSGAQNRGAIRKPYMPELKAMTTESRGALRVMTIAPEVDGAPEVIKFLKSKNIIPSIGHTMAAFEETEGAIDIGASCATHVFNAMGAFDYRRPGAIEAVLLDPRISATVILDGKHVSPPAFRLLLKCKGKEKVILITDSLKREPAFNARWDGSAYRLKDGTLAGSGLTMIKAVENAVNFGGISLGEAVSMAALNPARLLGLNNKGEIKKGKDADMVIFNRRYEVLSTIVEGRIVYEKCAA